jgi:predicted membrane channel-forming protein YqfA (hemolysin III family)
MLDYKIIFSSLVASVLLIATSSIGIQSLDQQKKSGMNKTFLIVALVIGIIGVIMALAGGGLKYKS